MGEVWIMGWGSRVHLNFNKTICKVSDSDSDSDSVGGLSK